jgi:hypothetical protein
MGRRPRIQNEPATHRIKFAATASELDRWKAAAKAAGVTLAQYIRDALDARSGGRHVA